MKLAIDIENAGYYKTFKGACTVLCSNGIRKIDKLDKYQIAFILNLLLPSCYLLYQNCYEELALKYVENGFKTNTNRSYIKAKNDLKLYPFNVYLNEDADELVEKYENASRIKGIYYANLEERIIKLI